MRHTLHTLGFLIAISNMAMAQSAAIDPSFATGTGSNKFINEMVLQPDGKILIGGYVNNYNGTPCNRLVRVNANGSVDPSFTIANNVITNSLSSVVFCLALQPDGKLVIGGNLTKYTNGYYEADISRVDANGNLDASFNPGTGTSGQVLDLALQADGKILIAGQFTAYNGTPIANLARLNADGSLDTGFNSNNTGVNAVVHAVAIQPDGKILIAGGFTSYNGTACDHIARLNGDGSLDNSFNAGANASAVAMALQNDGKVLVAGAFTTFNGTPKNYLTRINANGSSDLTFDPGWGPNLPFQNILVTGTCITVQQDGQILISGGFTSYNGVARNGIARLRTDGSLDPYFDPGSGANGSIIPIAEQPDGKILIAGEFTSYNGMACNNFTRLQGYDCPLLHANIGSPCNDGDPNTANDSLDATCSCAGNPLPPCTGDRVVVNLHADGAPGQITWEIRNAGNAVLATGAPLMANALNSDTVCLDMGFPNACYGFRIMDSFGDGITAGGWELRTTDGKLILRDDFTGGTESPSASPLTPSYGSSHSFCMPMGAARPATNECGVFTNGLGNKVYTTTVPGASQYEFEFSDPDAGFVARVISTHNYVHFWDIPAPGLTPGVKYLTRVRTNAAGPLASAHFGVACQMGLSVPVVVRCSELINAPDYGHSCNETRAFGTNNSFIYAKPVTGASEYQFRIYIPGEGYDTVITRSTYILQLKWNGNPLENGSTYNVQVQVKVNGLYSGFCPSSCTITIANPATRPEARMAEGRIGETSMWPNPVQDGQVNLSISGLNAGSPAGDPAETLQQIAVDVQDIYGKQVFSKEYGNSGDRFTTVLDLPGDIATGVYMVNITVDGERTVQRLSVIR